MGCAVGNPTGLVPQTAPGGTADWTPPPCTDDYSDSGTYSPAQTALRASFIAVNSLAVIVGNALSLAVMRFVDSPRLPPSSRVFLCNVILWDLAFGALSVPSFAPAVLNRWPYGRFLCRATGAAVMFVNLCCVNAAVLATVDRLLAVVYPLRHPALVSSRRALAIIATALLLAASATAAICAGADVSYSHRAALCYTQWSRVSRDDLFRLLVSNGFLLVLPGFVLAGCYTKLYLAARGHERRLAELREASAEASGRGPGSGAANGRALRMCLLITVTFCVAWTPYVVVSTLNFATGESSEPWVEFLACWVCLCNSWWDVIIYFVLAREFRKTARKLLCRRRM